MATHARSLRLLERLVIVALGLALFAVQAILLRDWLVDDSGISFAYAINLAQGHGLVSQPGVAPVEGYSNPVWVALLAALSRSGAFALPLAPKIVSGAFVAATYATLLALIDRVAVHPRLVGICAVVACALNPAVVIWCSSGLENATYAWIVVTLAYGIVRAIESPPSTRTFAICGAAAAVAAMTRPDGVLFAIATPAAAFATGARSKRPLLAYGATFAFLFGAFLAARIAIFHHLVPNTAVAKGGPHLADAIDFLLFTRLGIDKLDALLEAAFPAPIANVVFAGASLAVWALAKHGGIRAPLKALLVCTALALVDYMLMPADWMRETRFGTAFFPLYDAAVFVLIDLAVDLATVRRKALAVATVLGSLLCISVPAYAGRALTFARDTNISLYFVRSAYAERFDRYAAALHVANGSVLLPDIGGMLLWSHLRVYDLAGLCDASIARLGVRDPEGARDHILADVRPTFIHTYGKFSRVALERDPRFDRDYVPIHTYDKEEDPASQGHASGIFVRREVVATPEAEVALESMRRETHDRKAFYVPLRPSLLYRWLEHTRLIPVEYRGLSIRHIVL